MVFQKENTSVSINLIRILSKFMTQNGFDPADILEKARIDPLILKDPEARISTTQFNIIWKEILSKENYSNMGLHFGREIAAAYIKGNILYFMMANAGTLRNALEVFCKYHILSEDAILPKLRIENDLVFLSWETDSPFFNITRQISEALLSANLKIIRSITDDNLKPREVRFQHEKPVNVQEYENIFRAALRFKQLKNEMVLENSSLEIPIFLSDPTIFKTLEQLSQKLLDQLYDSNKWTNKVLRLTGKTVARGESTSIDSIASDLAVSPRKLQNKLKSENTTFQEVLDQVRKETATVYLRQKKISICEIALLLGFSEQSAFNRAFRRWTNLTPGQYRKSII